MQRAKTVKRTKTIINTLGATPVQPAGPPQTQAQPLIQLSNPLDFLQNVEKGMDLFFASENKNTLKKPWIKLDRALKIDRIRLYANEYPGLNDQEKASLTQTLLNGLERGLLKTRIVINYNTESCKIEDIKGLIVSHTESGRTFKIEIQRATKRRSRVEVDAKTPETKTEE
jgi:hypothetical protein